MPNDVLRMLRKGFTLIELLVVIAIIAILAAILFPVFTSAKAKGRDTTCLMNVKQIGLSTGSYIETWNSRYPPSPGFKYIARPSLPWLLRSYTKNKKLFMCPSAPPKPVGATYEDWDGPDGYWEWANPDGTVDKGNYGVNIGLAGAKRPLWHTWGSEVPTASDVQGASHVIFLSDSRWVDLCGASPGRIGKARFRHNGGLMLLCADWHVTWVAAADMVFQQKTDKAEVDDTVRHTWRWDYQLNNHE